MSEGIRANVGRITIVVLAIAVVTLGLGFYGLYLQGGGPLDTSDESAGANVTDESAGTNVTDESSDTDVTDESSDTDVAFVVESDLSPERASVDGIDGSGPRPVGRLENDDGTGTDFVAAELIVRGERDVARTLADRWNGRVRATIDYSDQVPSAPLEPTHLVAIDPGAVDDSTLEEDVATLVEASGEYRVSDERARKLLAAVARARVEGYDVGANFLVEPVDVADGETKEAPLPNNPGNWSADDFYHLNDDETPRVGVTKAWKYLDRAGKLDEEVRVAVIDSGFVAHRDIPRPYVRSDDVGDVGNGDNKWHGTTVSSAALADVDNGFGTAGPAGPVARPILLEMNGDFFDIDGWMRYASFDLDADVIVISWSGDLLGVSDAFRGGNLNSASVAVSRWGDTVVVTSAGNDGKNVDADRRLIGGEKEDVRPCENDRTLCVGGLEPGTTVRHSDSNFGTGDGSNTVDIYAPYCMRVGPTPNKTSDGSWDTSDVPNAAGWGCGTSYSAPMVAGIAALMRAADPSMGAAEIRSTLQATARSNSRSENVDRIVNAEEAVRGAFDYNYPPAVTITYPIDNSYPHGRIETLSARVDDYEDTLDYTPRSGVPPIPGPGEREETADPDYGDRVRWEIDGTFVGTGTHLPVDADDLEPGTHTISVTYTDAGGQTATDSQPVSIASRPPHVEIESPTDGATFPGDEVITFEGTTMDRATGEPVPTSQVTWHSDVDGEIGSGHTVSTTALSKGEHRITLRAENDYGEASVETIHITVVDAKCAGDAAASASIGNPADGAEIETDHLSDGHFQGDEDVRAATVAFSGWACDEDGQLIEGDDLTWMAEYTYEGQAYISPLGDGTETTHDLYSYECYSNTEYTIKLDAWDESAGEHYVAEHTVEVVPPIC